MFFFAMANLVWINLFFLPISKGSSNKKFLEAISKDEILLYE